MKKLLFITAGLTLCVALGIKAIHESGPAREARTEIEAALALYGEEARTRDAAERVGAYAAQYNPALTGAERQEIGRAVLFWSAEREIDPELVLAVITVESGFRPGAVSPAGARGLMQVMPRWAAPGEDLFAIDANIRIGTEILADNMERWGEVEGIQRYFWGVSAPDGRYWARVHAALKDLRK